MQQLEYGQSGLWEALKRFGGQESASPKVAESVSAILADIRSRGDDALVDHTERLDKVRLKPGQMRVPAEALESAAKSLPAATRTAIKRAITSVREFHRRGLPHSWKGRNPHGAIVGELFHPIERVGLYIPGGSVPLVSTVVMTATLAKLAKVPSIAACTPPGKDGLPNAGLLAAFHLCGVDEVYTLGGPMAIGAMAYGTASIQPVDKVFGPGNAYMTEAKRQVLGSVGIDILAGPSEVLIIADETADPAYVAADLIAQAEHGSGFEKVVLVTTDPKLPARVQEQLDAQVPQRSHRAAIEKVLQGDGYCVVTCDTLEQAAEVAQFMAPEHLELQTATPTHQMLLRNIRTAGAIFIGHETPTVLGDFAAGPNHTLPTLRMGRFYSGLQITDFLRRSSIVRYDARSLPEAAPIVRAFAQLEQLDGHGESLEFRLRNS